MINNRKETYKLSDIVKEMKLIKRNVPSTTTILSWLRGTEFDVSDGNLSKDTVYTYKDYTNLKKFINKTIINKANEKKMKNKLERIYLYISVGGTPELKNQFKIEAKDHLSTKVLSPKGCDKYCTENQIGKPQNWVKLPPILMPNGDYYETVKMYLNNSYTSTITKISNDIYQVKSDYAFINVMRDIYENIFKTIETKWFDFNLKNE